MTEPLPTPRTYSQLYARCRDYVAIEIEEAVDRYIEDDGLEHLIIHGAGGKVLPKDADYRWANGIVMSQLEMATEPLPAGGNTLLRFMLDTIRAKVVRDLLEEFEPTFARLRQEHAAKEAAPK